MNPSVEDLVRAREAVDSALILVVDDVEANREVLSRRLRRQGHRVIEATDGSEALEVLGAERVDLVLLDIMMPGVDGYQVLERMKAHEEWRHLPVVMISALNEMEIVARCIELGAEDYLPKPFNSVLLKARVAACLEKKRLRDRERRAYEALQESQRQLREELSEAAAYVRSLFPEPLTGEIRSDWRAVPSTELGGDSFGYHWIDSWHLGIYLLDVSGHGVGAALLSVSVANSLRAGSLPGADFTDPASVLSALNEQFPMEKHDGKFFTAWYGVYDRRSRELRYGTGGHPPAFRITEQGGERKTEWLRTRGLVLGGMPGATFEAAECRLDPKDELLVFSDGVYEVAGKSGAALDLEGLAAMARRPPGPGGSLAASILQGVSELRGAESFDDDFTVVSFAFD